MLSLPSTKTKRKKKRGRKERKERRAGGREAQEKWRPPKKMRLTSKSQVWNSKFHITNDK